MLLVTETQSDGRRVKVDAFDKGWIPRDDLVNYEVYHNRNDATTSLSLKQS